MIEVAEYRAHAAECRKTANAAPTESLRTELLGMAKQWTLLADARELHLKAKAEAHGRKRPN